MEFNRTRIQVNVAQGIRNMLHLKYKLNVSYSFSKHEENRLCGEPLSTFGRG